MQVKCAIVVKQQQETPTGDRVLGQYRLGGFFRTRCAFDERLCKDSLYKMNREDHKNESRCCPLANSVSMEDFCAGIAWR